MGGMSWKEGQNPTKRLNLKGSMALFNKIEPKFNLNLLEVDDDGGPNLDKVNLDDVNIDTDDKNVETSSEITKSPKGKLQKGMEIANLALDVIGSMTSKPSHTKTINATDRMGRVGV